MGIPYLAIGLLIMGGIAHLRREKYPMMVGFENTKGDHDYKMRPEIPYSDFQMYRIWSAVKWGCIGAGLASWGPHISN